MPPGELNILATVANPPYPPLLPLGQHVSAPAALLSLRPEPAPCEPEATDLTICWMTKTDVLAHLLLQFTFWHLLGATSDGLNLTVGSSAAIAHLAPVCLFPSVFLALQFIFHGCPGSFRDRSSPDTPDAESASTCLSRIGCVWGGAP